MYTYQSQWPRVDKYPQAIERLTGDLLSCDFEWDIRTMTPTITGLFDGKTAVSVPSDAAMPYFQQLAERSPESKWVGHNFISAEYPMMKKLGIPVELNQIEDTIIYHYLVNMHLCKSTGKSSDDASDLRGRGFMNVWSMCSIYTSLPNWKKHRGDDCGVCPTCDPFMYNSLDCIGPHMALTGLKYQAKLRGVDHLYPLHRDLAWKLHQMSERGVLVDVEYVENNLRKDFEAAKLVIYDKAASKSQKSHVGIIPFNPDSPKQVIDYFSSKNIKLPDTGEDTIRETSEKYPENAELATLLDWKELGDGPDRWFKHRTFNYKTNDWDGYVDDAGYIHGRMGFYTSSGRLNCVDPNLHNVPKRRVDRTTGEKIGKKMRRAIIAPEGYLLYRADISNGENRVVLHLAGYDIPEDLDLHTWVAEIAELDPASEFCIKLGGPREAAKSIQHAGNIFEGLDLKSDADLKKPRTQSDIWAGALLVYSDWRFEGYVICFNGINLAERAFGRATQENRCKALQIQAKYFNRFPKLRDLQRRYISKMEKERAVQTPLGYFTLSYGPNKDRIKQCAAIIQSQPIAHATKIALLRDDDRLIDVLQIHDEILWYVDCRHDPQKVKEWIREKMMVEMPGFSGLKLPVEPSYGKNWADQVKL